jgi:tripartite-type tricarboxylate transporter receptor subunit TctC
MLSGGMRARSSGLALIGLSILAALGFAGPLAAQEWTPTKPIHIIANQPAGGSTDLMTRLLAQHLSEALGQPVVVDNKPGAGGAIGTQLLAQAAPDGYTIGTISSSHASNATLMKDLPFDLKAIQPLTMQGRQSNILVVNPALPAQSLKELIALAKAKPGMHFASSGIGVANHFAGEMLKIQAGVDIQHVPYRGGAPALADVMAGHIPMMFNGFAATLPTVKDGKLRALAVTSAQRSPVLPDVPTMIESGLPGFEITEWYGLAVPASTTPAAVQRLYAEIAKVMRRPDVVERLTALGIDITTPPPEEFNAFVQQEIKRYRDIVTSAKIEIK